MPVDVMEGREVSRGPQSVLFNPYPGLRPFAETEQRLFFGRASQINEILQRLEKTSFAVLTGGSGSGKSSIVNAGVIPALRRKQLASRGDFWLVATFSPKDRPFRNLASALAKLIKPLPGVDLVDDVEQTLLEANSLAGFFERYEDRIMLEDGQAPESRKSANLLIFCDQFEEIFRDQNRDNPEAAQLVDLIVEAYKNQSKYPRLFLMIGMRSEDLHRCAAFIDLPNVINGSIFLTRRLDEAEIVSAIVEPMRLSLRLRGIVPERYSPVEVDPWPFDADVLHRLNRAVAAMASDPDHLPLLQHLLSVLWKFLEKDKLPAAEKSPEHAQALCVTSEDLAEALGFPSAKDMDDFARLNGERQPQKWNESWILKRALDRAAESVQPADPRLQSITGRMFRLLAEVDDRGNYKRRWTSRQEILDVSRDRKATPEEVDNIIAAFSNLYPFLNARPGLDGKIDVSHESFIRNWTRFTEWLRNERRLAVAYDALRTKYLARQRVLKEQGSNLLTMLWPGSSTRFSRDQLIQLGDWRVRRGENVAWANRYINGIQGEDPDSERRSGEDNQTEAFNKSLLRFYQRAKLASYRKVAGWGLTAVAIIGVAIMWLEFEQRTVTSNREIASAGATVISSNFTAFNNVRGGVDAREIDGKLFQLTNSKAIILSAGHSDRHWVDVLLKGYRTFSLRTDEPGAFYYVARSAIDRTSRKLLDNAMFPADPTTARRPLASAAMPLSAQCRAKLDEGDAVAGALAKSEELVLAEAKVTRAPLEPSRNKLHKQVAIIPTNQGNLVMLSLSTDGDECTAKYLQSLSLPPGKALIDEALRLVVVNVPGAKPEDTRAYIYRLWWTPSCNSEAIERGPPGRCEVPYTVEITGPIVADGSFRIVDRSYLETGGGANKRRFNLRSAHRPLVVNSADVPDVFKKVNQDSSGSPRCAKLGRHAVVIKGVDAKNPSDLSRQVLYVVESTAPIADCQKISAAEKIAENVIAEIPLENLAIGDMALFSDKSDDGDAQPDYIYLKSSEGDPKENLVFRIALSPRKMYCLGEVSPQAQLDPLYLGLVRSRKLSDDDVLRMSREMIGVPPCSARWDRIN